MEGADDGDRKTNQSMVIDAEAHALAGVQPFAERDRAVGLAVRSLPDSRPDGCSQGRQMMVRTDVQLHVKWDRRTELALVHELDRERGRGRGAADDSEESEDLHSRYER